MSARPRQISDEEILQGARECFLAHGPGVSTQVIAERLGISQPALFKRFNTKEELMISALLPPLDLPATSWLKSVRPSENFDEQLEELIQVLWESLKIVFPRISVLTMSGIPHEQIHSRFKKLPLLVILDATADWILEAQQKGLVRPEGDPYIWAQTCMGALQGRAAMQYFLRRHFESHADARYQNFADEETFVRLVADLLRNGMAVSRR